MPGEAEALTALPRLLIATTNPGKLREIRDALAGAGLELSGLRDLSPVAEPDESGTTFADNARLKARYYAQETGLLTVAEDSGLSIDALQGQPGVHSARYLDPSASYASRFADIERRLATVPARARTARFVCALAVAAGDDVVFEATGMVEGTIATRARGSHGFGYDPIFFYPPFGATLAEVSAERKLAVSHRGQAFGALRQWLTEGGAQSVLEDLASR